MSRHCATPATTSHRLSLPLANSVSGESLSVQFSPPALADVNLPSSTFRGRAVRLWKLPLDQEQVNETFVEDFLQSPECQRQPLPLLSLDDVENNLLTPKVEPLEERYSPDNPAPSLQSSAVALPAISSASTSQHQDVTPQVRMTNTILGISPARDFIPASQPPASTPVMQFIHPAATHRTISNIDYSMAYASEPCASASLSCRTSETSDCKPPASLTSNLYHSARRRGSKTRQQRGMTTSRTSSPDAVGVVTSTCNPMVSYAARMDKLRQQKANARRREHERVKKTRMAFEQLKMCLIRSDPIAKKYMRCFNMVSKINILKAATAHIAELTNQLAEHDRLQRQEQSLSEDQQQTQLLPVPVDGHTCISSAMPFQHHIVQNNQLLHNPSWPSLSFVL